MDKWGKSLLTEMHPSITFHGGFVLGTKVLLLRSLLTLLEYPVSKRHLETTPLHLAAEGGMSRILVLFLERGANPNTRSSR